VPATKTFTTRLAALAVLAIGLGGRLDPGELRAVPGAVEDMLRDPGDIDLIPGELSGAQGLVVLAAQSGPTLTGTVELAHRVREAGARAYGIGGGERLASATARALPGPRLPEWLAPIGLLVPGQLLAETLARHRGIDPDHPRGLHKVTQTDQQPRS
jgi:glucosamine--fructose-6-phosphate aminotransferase (isomerizing)